ncbi:recombinase family protein [Burkholderia gladioli]|uniref:recombinase family protein n=1 Tax=Burkholderia gladioli TaxID=28095 RepID=UPI0030E157C6
MRIGYARVSTDEQCLDLQLRGLRMAGCDEIVTDHGLSGLRHDRPGLIQLLDRVSSGDTIVVWRLDRLGRSLSQLVQLMEALRQRGVHFSSTTEMIDTGSPTGMFIFHMIAALAEFERALISERTRAGMAAARERGSKVGRPPVLSEKQLEEACELLQNHTLKEVARHFMIDAGTLRKKLRKRAGHT